MATKIAVIGSHEFINRIETVSPLVADIEIDPYIYQKPQDASGLVRKMKPCDVILFSGALPYYFSEKDRENLPIPAVYLATDEMAIASSLLSILYNQHINPERISIDIIDSSVVTNVLNEIHVAVPSHVLDYRQFVEKDFDLDQIVQFHMALWKQEKVDLALTSIHAVYDKLQTLKIPSIRINDPKVSLIRGLQHAKNQAELYKSKASQVAVGYISASIPQASMARFAQKIHASFQKLDDTLFIFYSTRGDIEAMIGQNFSHGSISDKKPVTVGFGFGATTTEAERNARVALHFAEKDGAAHCCYVLTGDKELLGPFPNEAKQQRLKNDDPELFEIARETRLSPANLSKLVEFSRSRQSPHFTAADLSEYLQVTRRSAERILKKLSDHGYAERVGNEMTYQQGRPRAIYQMNMPIYK